MQPEDRVMQEAGKALGLGNVALEVYRDLLQPSAQEVGASLVVVARAVGIALAPLEGAVWGYQQLREWLSLRLTAKLSATPPEEIIAPATNIAGPALLQLHFVQSESELREMYANLLATAMSTITASVAHPAFVSVIQQLSPDEARIMSAIATADRQLFLREVIDGRTEFPVSGSQTISVQWRAYCSSLALQALDGCESYLDNLVRLRLLELNFASTSEYLPERADRYGDYPPMVDHSNVRELELCNFGFQFIKACVLEPGQFAGWE